MRLLFSDSRSPVPFLGVLTGCLVFLLTSCAPPEVEEPSPTPTPNPEGTDPDTPQTPLPTATPLPDVVVAPTPEPRPTFDPADPDWSVRYRMLKEHYESQFAPRDDLIGQRLDIPLAGGGVRTGVLKEIRERSVLLELENGSMELHADAMDERAQRVFFKEYFSHLSAVAQARSEHSKWQKMQEEANRPKPTATPYPRFVQQPMVPKTRPEQGDDPMFATYRPDPNAKPPKNEGPAGRVWQVDSYLRRNSAVPHSLRYKKWFPVQQHGKGYKVRVQYSVESAGGLGTSNEDMMFFMHADGKVYQRAGVK